MMKKNKIRILTSLLTVVFCFTIYSTIAFAASSEEEYIESIPEVTETPRSNSIPLTPDGNLTLVDDVAGEQAEDKQFVTLVSKNGNYFYLVIDRAGDRQNVYFLNLVDESDLLALIEDEVTKQSETPQVCYCTDKCGLGNVESDCIPCKNDLTKCMGKTSEPAAIPEPEKSSGVKGNLLVLLFVGAVVGGGFYYFKVIKNKSNTKGSTDLDDYEFDDEDDDEYEYEMEDEEESEVDIQ